MSGCFSAGGDAWLWGFGTNSQLGKGDDDADEPVPRRLAETKRFQGRRVVQLEFGGQHALLLAVPKQAPNGAVPSQTVAAAAPDASASAAAAPVAAKEAEAPAAVGEEPEQAPGEEVAAGSADGAAAATKGGVPEGGIDTDGQPMANGSAK